MKVICIDTPDILERQRHMSAPHPKEGDIDEVIEDGNDSELGEYYCLARFGDKWGYSKHHFIPLSDINEEEFERNYETKKELA